MIVGIAAGIVAVHAGAPWLLVGLAGLSVTGLGHGIGSLLERGQNRYMAEYIAATTVGARQEALKKMNRTRKWKNLFLGIGSFGHGGAIGGFGLHALVHLGITIL